MREAPDKCKVGDVEVDATGWTVISLRPRLDGSLAGEYTWATTPALCANKRAINLSPTSGSGTGTEAPDPAQEPALRASPGAALRGVYTYTQTYPATGEVFPARLPGHHALPAHRGTVCDADVDRRQQQSLRDAVRRRTFHRASFPEGDAQCTDGVGKVRQSSRDDLPLPQGPQDPITLLTGTSFQDYVGDCPAQVELDVRLQRTGD